MIQNVVDKIAIFSYTVTSGLGSIDGFESEVTRSESKGYV